MADVLNLSDRDIDALSRIVQAEAGNQSEEGQRAVFYTVLNRAISGQGGFPNSVQGVIEQRGQFEPMGGRSSWTELPEAQGGYRDRVLNWVQGFGSANDPTGGATFFQNEAITNERGTNFADGNTGRTAVIGDHAFYDRYGNGEPVRINPYALAYGGNQYAPTGATQAINNALLNPPVDPAQDYLARNPGLRGTAFERDPYSHYLKYGQAEGRVWNAAATGGGPSNVPLPVSRPAQPAFDGGYGPQIGTGGNLGSTSDPGAAYLAANPDLMQTEWASNPYGHWFHFGSKEGRQGGSGFTNYAPIPTPRPTQAAAPNFGNLGGNYGQTRDVFQPQQALYGNNDQGYSAPWQDDNPFLDGGYSGYSASAGGNDSVPMPTARPAMGGGYSGIAPIPTPRPQIGSYQSPGAVPVPTGRPYIGGGVSNVPVPTSRPTIGGYSGNPANVPLPTPRPSLGGSGLPAGYSGVIPRPTPRPTSR